MRPISGVSIWCALGASSKVGKETAGSGPRLVSGFAAAGLTELELVVGIEVVTGAVGIDGRENGEGLAVVAGLGEMKSLTVGEKSGFALVQVDTSVPVMGFDCGYGKPS